MANPLTQGAIKEILLNPKNPPKRPILQVLDLKKLVTTSQENGPKERYRIVLSDSIHVHTYAMLVTQLNYMVNDNQLDVDAIIRLDKYVCDVIEETRKVLILVEVTVLKKGLESPRYGRPVKFYKKTGGRGSISTIQSNSPSVQQSSGSVNENQQSSNGSKFDSSQSPLSQSQSGPAIFPIASLTPYRNRWTICAHVTSKSNIRKWSNSGREGLVFNVDLIDKSSEIRATCFDDLVEKFYPLIEQNKVYFISNGKLGPAKKMYSSIEHDFELTFNNKTKIELCTEDYNLPTQKFNFRKIGKIQEIQPNLVIDLIGVCLHISELLEITTRTGEQVSKRDITLVDQTADVNCTLWRKDAENFGQYHGLNPIVAIKGAKVSDYGGRSLNLVPSSVVRVNPNNLEEALNLRGWYDNLVSSENITSLSSQSIKEIESPELWTWEKSSKVHEEKIIKLREYGKDHPEEIIVVNGVRVCCSEEFLLGMGSDGTRVYVGLGKDGYEKAVKRLPRDVCTGLAEQEKKTLNECNAFKSKYVVNYWFYDKSDKHYLYLILDLCEETLKTFVQRSSSDELVRNAPAIFQQILKGLADLHRGSTPILHRDLKPSNILRNVQGNWLLADFGISRILTEGASTHRSKQRGTEGWRAVESYPSNSMTNDGKGRYKKESDIQVAGMVAYHIVTKGGHAFGEEQDRLRNLLAGEPVGLDTLEDLLLKDLLSWMLSHDPKDRPSAEEALKHPFLQTVEQQFEMLCKMGNQQEIKAGDSNSPVVRKLNNDPTDWKNLMRPDVLKYLCTDFSNGNPKTFRYKSSWTECLRLIRNVNQHWRDRPRPRPQPEAFYLVDNPQEYFLNLFPNLLVRVHRIIQSCDWKERLDLKEFFV